MDHAVLTFSSQEDLALAAAEEGGDAPEAKEEEEALRVVPRESARAARKAYDIVRRSFSARSKSSFTSRRF